MYRDRGHGPRQEYILVPPNKGVLDVSRRIHCSGLSVFAANRSSQPSSHHRCQIQPKPRVIMVGVMGGAGHHPSVALKGQMPIYPRDRKGARKTPHCLRAKLSPRLHHLINPAPILRATGVTGLLVGGITANTHMLKQEPIWSNALQRGHQPWHGQRASHFPGHAVKRLHDQRHAHPRQEL